MAELFAVASKASMALFEGLGVQGTSLLVQNGLAAGQRLAHIIAHVLPRQEGDGLLEWERKQLSEEQMSTVELKLKPELRNVGIVEKEKPKPIVEEKPKETEDWLKHSLRRIP
jgi:diadenosine tetraphosphate (Ap4A) HIT family hydrolase